MKKTHIISSREVPSCKVDGAVYCVLGVSTENWRLEFDYNLHQLAMMIIFWQDIKKYE